MCVWFYSKSLLFPGTFSHIFPKIFSKNLVLNICVTFILHDYTTIHLFFYSYTLRLQETSLNNLGALIQFLLWGYIEWSIDSFLCGLLFHRKESSSSLRAPWYPISFWHLKELLFSALPVDSELNTELPWVLEALNLGLERVPTDCQGYLGGDWLHFLLWERKHGSWNDSKDSLRWSGKILGNRWHMNIILSNIEGWSHLLRLREVSLNLEAWGMRKVWAKFWEKWVKSDRGSSRLMRALKFHGVLCHLSLTWHMFTGCWQSAWKVTVSGSLWLSSKLSGPKSVLAVPTLQRSAALSFDIAS